MTSIEDAIQQSTFASAHHRSHVNLTFTAAWMNQLTIKALKPHGLSLQQFNILRILRGRGGRPATIKLLTERMLDKMSNASRLIDKLEEKKLVQRRACAEDRRRVDILITAAGLELLERASQAVEQSQLGSFAALTEAESNQLSHLLDKLRTLGESAPGQ
jgi:DNA-binding MarR family transcriptional regulator